MTRDGKVVFVRSIPDGVGSRELLDLFPYATRASMAKTGKGFGFVEFSNEDDARDAIERGASLNHKTLDVKFSDKPSLEGMECVSRGRESRKTKRSSPVKSKKKAHTTVLMITCQKATTQIKAEDILALFFMLDIKRVISVGDNKFLAEFSELEGADSALDVDGKEFPVCKMSVQNTSHERINDKSAKTIEDIVKALGLEASLKALTKTKRRSRSRDHSRTRSRSRSRGRDRKERTDHKESSSMVFVGGVPSDTTPKALYSLFGCYGEINALKFIQNKEQSKTKCALVEYKESSQSELARQHLNKLEMSEGLLKVELSQQSRIKDLKDDPATEASEKTYGKTQYRRRDVYHPDKHLFVAGVRAGVTEETIRSVFQLHGTLDDVRISKGLGGNQIVHVTYEDKKCALNALLALHGECDSSLCSEGTPLSLAFSRAQKAPKS